MGVAAVHRWTRRALLLALLVALLWIGYAYLKGRPQDLPWTPLRLDELIGLFTGRKLAGLTGDRAACMTLLARTGLKYAEVEPRTGGQCAVPDAVRVEGQQTMLSLTPADVAPSCPVVAGLAMWKWQVVEPAAQRIFGTSVRALERTFQRRCDRHQRLHAGGWATDSRGCRLGGRGQEG